MEGKYLKLCADIEYFLGEVREGIMTPEQAHTATREALKRFAPNGENYDCDYFVEQHLYDTLAKAVKEWAINY